MMDFDVQSIIIGLAVFALLAVIAYSISALTLRERTFEQVMEEQRGRQGLVSTPKPAKMEKPKKKAKKPKQKTDKSKNGDHAQHGDDEVDTGVEDHKMVQYDPDPEVIEVKVELPVSEHGPRKRKKESKKGKPILVNKNEKVLVKVKNQNKMELVKQLLTVHVQLLQPDLTAVEMPHNKKPLDDIELKFERQRRDSERSSFSVDGKVKLAPPTDAIRVF